MYWVFLIFFILAVLSPDIVRGPFYFLPEERAEEVLIFLAGAAAFFVFIANERKIQIQKRESQKAEKKIDQAVKDLVESYSYIGEVNRKMDILMGIALGLADNADLSKKKENEIYESIVAATAFLMKADKVSLRFVSLENSQTKRDFCVGEMENQVSNKSLVSMGGLNVKKEKEILLISSPQAVNSVKCYLIISGYDPGEEKSPKNTEILKVFASQALFLYSFMEKRSQISHEVGSAPLKSKDYLN